MFGAGIYMGGPAKAIGYTRNCGYWKRSKSLPDLEYVHYLLEVEVALGKVKECQEAERHTQARLDKEGFNSVGGFAGVTASWAGTLRHDEYVVYNPNQVIVHRILEYHSQMGSTTSVPPTHGACQVIREKDVPLTKRNRAFRDVIARQACGKVSYTLVGIVGGVPIWICAECAERLKIRSGSKVEILRGNSPYGTSAARMGPTTIVRLQ
jgi:hypothetical protein